jgi:release factor glutamine methyltransferase
MAADLATNGGPWTVGRLLEWTTRHFRERKIDAPRLDAEVLLAHVLACRRIDLYASFDAEVAPADRAAYRNVVRQRTEGKPVAYLVGKREFYSLDFEVDPSVLIPRPETEILVGEALQRLPREAPSRFLDVGVGSGAVAVAIAAHRPLATAVAVDVSPATLNVAEKNARKHGVDDRISFSQSNLYDRLPPGDRFDLIVSNPPYVRTSETPRLAREVREYEPSVALAGGDDGLACLRPLLEGAPDRLVAGGWILVEFGIDHAEPLRAIAEAVGRYDAVVVVDDAQRRPRVFGARVRA